MPAGRISLDNPIFSGRLRASYEPREIARPVRPANRAALTQTRVISDFAETKPAKTTQAPLTQPVAAEEELNFVPQQLPPMTTRVRKPRRVFTQSRLIAAAAVVVLVFGLVVVGLVGLRGNRQVDTQAQVLSSTASASSALSVDSVDEARPPSALIASHSVEPNLPRRLIIDKIAVEARIFKMGVTTAGDMDIPRNIHDVAWYENSVKPGEAGATVLVGHVSGPTTPGVFKNLKNLVTGDAIEIEKGDGTFAKYKVMAKEVVDTANFDLAHVLTPIKTGKSGLNLVTFTGKFNASINSYEQRLIVFATEE